MKSLKKIQYTLTIFSVIILLLGAGFIIWPQVSALVVCYIMGCVILMAGIIKIICYIKRDFLIIPFYHELAYGIFDIIISVILFLHPQDAIIFLPVIVGIVIILDSILKFQTASALKKVGMQSWITILILAACGILFGLMLALNPFEGINALMILLGITLVVDGIQNLCTIISITKYIKKKAPIETTYTILDP